MKHLYIILLILPLIGFGQEKKISFQEPWVFLDEFTSGIQYENIVKHFVEKNIKYFKKTKYKISYSFGKEERKKHSVREIKNHNDYLIVRRDTIYLDSNNNIESIIYHDNGEGQKKHQYNYDSNKNLEEKKTLWNDIISRKIIFKYDTINHNLIEKEHWDNQGVYKGVTYKYDNNNNLIEKTIFFDGDSYDKFKYEYDGNNYLIEEKQYKYDSEGNIKTLSGGQEMISTTNYEYDNKGNLIKEGNTIFEYDPINNNLIEWNEISWKFTFKYDQNNNIIEILEHQLKNEPGQKTFKLSEVIIFEYEYKQ